MTPRLKCWLWRGFLWVHWEKTVRQGVLSYTWYTRDCSNWHPVHTFPGWNTLTSAFWKGLGTGAHWSFVRRKRKISYCFKPKFPMDGIPGILFRGWFPDETKMFVTVNPVTWSGCNSANNLAHTSPTWARPGLTPPLTIQTMLDACIKNLVRVSTLYRVCHCYYYHKGNKGRCKESTIRGQKKSEPQIGFEPTTLRVL